MATAAAAVIARARRDIQHHFFAADAVRPDRALSFVPASRIEARQLDRMVRRGVVRSEGAGRFWIDVVAYDVDLRRRHRIVATVLACAAIGLGVALILAEITAR